MAASTAPPSSLVSTCWVFPVKGKCAAWSSPWTLYCSASLLAIAQKSGHRFPTICGARAALLPTTFRSRFALTTCSVLFFPLYTIAPTTQGAQTRSFRRSGTDRPFRPICSSPSADFQLGYVQSSHTNPATYTLICRLVVASKPVCRGRPYWTLARPPSTCSGWDGCSFQQQSSILGSSFVLPPAGFLPTDVRIHHTVTQNSPSRGAVTEHSSQQVHTLSRNNAGTRFQA